MATLIPALGSCVARMTPGERRTAERLEQKLDADYLLDEWCREFYWEGRRRSDLRRFGKTFEPGAITVLDDGIKVSPR